VQVGPVKYSKAEEKILLKSFILSLLIGLPSGMLLNFAMGFPTLTRQVPTEFSGWVLFLSSWLVSVAGIWFSVATILHFLFYKKARLLNSWSDVGRVVWVLFVFFPVMFVYIILVFSAIFVPLEYATPWLSPIRQYWLGFLFFFPFVFLFFVVFLPDQKPRRLLGRFWLVLNGRVPFPKPSLGKAISVSLILAWLLVVFLPLPESPFIHITVIGGGLAVLAYLMTQRRRGKRRKKAA